MSAAEVNLEGDGGKLNDTEDVVGNFREYILRVCLETSFNVINGADVTAGVRRVAFGVTN